MVIWDQLMLLFLGVGCLNVNIPRRSYEHFRGENITVPCKFKSRVAKPSLVVVSWSVLSFTKKEETRILTHYSATPERKTQIHSTLYEGRVSVDVKVTTGKAKLKLYNVTAADNKMVKCRVQIPGDEEGKQEDVAQLLVLAAPSLPVCKIQGKAEYGQNIILTCVSDESYPPAVYKWESRDIYNIQYIPDQRTTDNGGTLSLYNITKHTSGHYICTSSNKINSTTCNITLSVMPPSGPLASVSGLNVCTIRVIAAVIGFLIILIIVVYYYCCQKTMCKKEENDIYMNTYVTD